MIVEEIIQKYLRDNMFDGLCCEDCGCGIDDLVPCDANFLECEPAYYNDCATCAIAEKCEEKDSDVLEMYCATRCHVPLPEV